MADELDRFDESAAPRRARSGPKVEGRLAVRALVQRLEWANWPMVHWTGSPAAAAAPSPAHAIQARLKSLPAGLYVVRLGKPKPTTQYQGFEKLLEAMTPVVEEVIPVNQSLIARSLRRLLDSRRFPLLLPQAVGDANGWRAKCESAIGRARAALDATTGGLDQLAGTCLILGQRPIGPPRPPMPSAVNKRLSTWPADVLSEAVRLLGEPRLQQLARACPDLNTPAVAAAVRDVLLLRPQALADFLGAVPSLLALHARLADGPNHRLRAAVAIQREAINAAIVECQLSGDLTAALDAGSRTGGKRLAWFHEVYERHLGAALDRHFEPILLAAPEVRGTGISRRAARNAVAFIADLLAARRLCVVLLGDAGRLAARGRLVQWGQREAKWRLCILGRSDSLKFENLAATACDLLWAMARPPEKGFEAGWLLTLAAADAIPCHPAAIAWIESCSRVWPLGPDQHAAAQAVILALHAVHVRAPADRHAETNAALDVAAPLVLRRALADPQRAAHAVVFDLAVLLCRGVAAGIDPKSLCAFIEEEDGCALERILDHAPGTAPAFVAMMRPWIQRWTAGARSGSDRHQRLVEWGWVRWHSAVWASAFIILGPGLLQQFLELLAPLPITNRVRPVADAIDFVVDEAGNGADLSSLPPAKTMAPRRALLASGMPLLRSWLERSGDGEAEAGRVLRCFDRSVNVAYAVRESRPPASAECGTPLDLASELMRALMGLADDPGHGFYAWFNGQRLAALTVLARGKLDRLIAIGLAVDAFDWRELRQTEHAWNYLQRIEPLQEIVSCAAAREGRTRRVLRLLARLGLCLSLHRHAQLHKALAALIPPPPDPAADPPAADELTPGHGAALHELAHWSDGTMPERVREIVGRRAALRRELATLEARADLELPAQRRREHLQRILASPQQLAKWIRRDLDKVLPAALDDARLLRLEEVAEAAVMAHFGRILSAPLPAARNERNWDNALRLYFSADANRALLRQLLDHEARGDREWVRKLPANAKFVQQADALGVDIDAWLAPRARLIDCTGGPFRIEIETDPLHVLQMGNYFQTCLSEGDCNSFSTIANAVEVNKRVIYVYDPRGVVVGRKLIALTPQGQIVGFRTYGQLPGQPNGGADRLKAALDAFCRELADACHATLHPHSGSDDPQPRERTDPLALFAQWYNDGPEPFAPPEPQDDLRSPPAALRAPPRRSHEGQ